MRVYELKERTMDKLGFQLDKQILIFGHEKLETPRKLSDYNISNGSELRLVVDLEGMARRGDLTDDDVPVINPIGESRGVSYGAFVTTAVGRARSKNRVFPCAIVARGATVMALPICRLEKWPLPQMRLGPCFYGGCFELHRIFKV